MIQGNLQIVLFPLRMTSSKKSSFICLHSRFYEGFMCLQQTIINLYGLIILQLPSMIVCLTCLIWSFTLAVSAEVNFRLCGISIKSKQKRFRKRISFKDRSLFHSKDVCTPTLQTVHPFITFVPCYWKASAVARIIHCQICCRHH